MKFLLPLLMVFIGWLFSTVSNAGDIAQHVRQPGTNELRDGGYLEVGGGATLGAGATIKVEEKYANAAAVLAINAGYQYGRAFVDLYPESVTPLVLGINLFYSPRSVLDIVSGPQNGEFDAESIDYEANIKTRHMDYLVGFRFTHYFSDTILQAEARKDISKTHRGEFYLMSLGHSWGLANGTQHLLFGYAYQPAKVIDYYLGIRAAEASETIGPYTAGAASIFKLEYGVTYPLSAKWILRSQAALFYFGNAIAQSPLMKDSKNERLEISSSVSYVF